MARKAFEKACKSGTDQAKERTMEEYIKLQKAHRQEIEKEETTKMQERLEKLATKAKIDPNIIWKARKQTKNNNELDYDIITEEEETITDPEKTKEYIANYFENLYQAREGTEDYKEWTKEISTTVRKTIDGYKKNKGETEDKITLEELNKAIKRLKRNKSLGPDQIPNEIFIEANRQTRLIYLEVINKIHNTETIPKDWREGELKRLYKGKGRKGKCSNERGISLASNVGKLYERIINERVKQQIRLTEAQGGGIEENATVDHLLTLKDTIETIRKKGKTAYVAFLDVQKAYDKAWLDAILYVLNKN